MKWFVCCCQYAVSVPVTPARVAFKGCLGAHAGCDVKVVRKQVTDGLHMPLCCCQHDWHC
jgi:hypothetical protein